MKNKGLLKKMNLKDLLKITAVATLLFPKLNDYEIKYKAEYLQGQNNQYLSLQSNLNDYIIPDKTNLKNAIIIVGSPAVDYNGAFKDFEEEIEKVKNAGYKIFIDTVSTKEEYFDSFKKGVNFLNGRFDFYLCGAHGSPKGIILGHDITVEDISTNLVIESLEGSLISNDLPKKDLSKYFNCGARGVQYSCSVADTSIKDNFAQKLSNSTKIPIEGLINDGIALLSCDLHLKSLDYSLNIPKSGFSPEGYGFFEDKNLKYYIKRDNEGIISVRYILGDNKENILWDLPPNFDISKVYYLGIFGNTNVSEKKPQK